MDFDLSAYKLASDWSSIPEEYLLGQLEETINQSRFPGIVVPAWVNGGVCWYAIAPEQSTWRTLQPIMIAFVGRTVTTFNGEPAKLNTGLKCEEYLATLNSFAIARLTPSKDILLTVRALSRMKETLLARPTDLRPPQMSTSQMISHFDMCLVEGDRNGALQWFLRLKEELRLDALNLNFTKVKLHATFRDWTAMVADHSFADLCRVTKPKVIAHHLLEALWFFHMESQPKDAKARKETYDIRCKSFVDDIIASSGIPSSWARETYKNYIGNSIDHTPTAVPAVEVISGHLTVSTVPPSSVGQDDDSCRQEIPSGDRGYAIPEKVSVSSQEDQLDGWLGWVKSLDKSEFRFREAAEDLALNIDAASIDDPELVREIEEALFELETTRELDRLEATLPQIIQWLKQDDGFPRKSMSPIYSIVLRRLIETHSREGEFREGITEVFTALLETGLSEVQYKSLLSDIGDTIPDGAGTADVFWLLDIAEVLTRFSAIQQAARTTLLNQILASLQSVVHQLSFLQQSAYENIATAAGWDPLPQKENAAQKSLSDLLEGKLVGIYTLTESSGRQAKAAIERISPGVKVEVSSEKVCTTRLTRLSQNADFMVVTTSSAKHAATDCIRAQRTVDSILYAAGRGYCSILRSLEDTLGQLA
ncbi:hypothetical protein N9L49_01600 [Rhodospirillales bacterium]|nr:hypothetical protein [Rhodospirillales bacterium]